MAWKVMLYKDSIITVSILEEGVGQKLGKYY